MRIKLIKTLLFFTFTAILTVGCKKEVEETPYFTLKDSIEVSREASFEFIEVQTNVSNWRIVVPTEAASWLTAVKEKGGFKIATVSNKGGERSATLQLIGERVTYNFLVTQLGIYPNPDSIENDLKLKIVTGSASSFQKGSEIEKVFDGNLKGGSDAEIYHSAWDNRASNYFPITIELALESAKDVDYMMYYPRTNSSNGHFKEVEIWVSTEKKSEYTKVKDVDFGGTGAVSRVNFGTTIVGARSFKLVVKSGQGNGAGFASAAEIEFYAKRTSNSDALSIFKDITCSELKEGITEQEIQSISNTFYKNIAMLIKNNQYRSEFRIQEYRAWADPNVIKTKNRMQYAYSNLDNPTGISVNEGEDLVVFVGETKGQKLQIKIMNLDKPGGDGFDQASYHPLYEGVNKIKAGSKGLIYLQYQTPNYATAPRIKIHFATGNVNGYYDKTKHTAVNDWNRLISAATNKYFDVIGEHAHLCYPTESYKAYATSKGKELIDIYDEIVRQTHIFAGTIGERAMANRAYFQVMYHSYMYCTAYRTSYHESTMSTVCNPDVLKTGNNIWGVAHEIGHAHQVPPVFQWIGMTEVSVNMNPMNIQTAWNSPTRLEVESMQGEGGYNNRYEKAYNIGLIPDVPNCEIPDVFCRLIPFWQLNLYFSRVKNDPTFYARFYEKMRTIDLKPTLKDGEYQVDFTKIASEMAGMNLISFFEKWGFYKPVDKSIKDYATRQLTVTQEYVDQIRKEINVLGLPPITDKIEYICDSNWTYFRDQSSVIKGTATRRGTTVTTSGYKNVVAYEVYSNNDLIYATNKNSFDFKNTAATNVIVYAIAYDGTRTEVTF
ncbi:M60 family metallopeptidase [Capnocytophaga canis]|nr:M60 family metallopeptidase [Capnocytophaga canis]